MTMPDGNAAAESRRNADEAKGEELREMYAEKALDDLVWRVMDGQEYPRQARYGQQIDLLDVICNVCDEDASVIARVIIKELDNQFTIHHDIESMVKDYLRDSKFHEMRIAEMIEEAKDEA